jgi:predicted methyltransferase
VTNDEVERSKLLNEIRFGERLAQRTARLYRRLQTGAALVTVIGLSAGAGGWAQKVPPALAAAGVVCAALVAAFAFVVRAGDKAAQNDAEAKRYARLQSEQHANDAATIRAAQLKARESDVPEVESIRDIAWNDVMRETGNDDKVHPLSALQKVLRALS